MSLTSASLQKQILAKAKRKRGGGGVDRGALNSQAPRASRKCRAWESLFIAVLLPVYTMSIRINATVNEARTAANHSQEQWDRFYVGPSSDAQKRLSVNRPSS